jgi:hypothetical protein
VFDTSRSMMAARASGEPTRFDRAAAGARRVRETLGDVPVGIATMTDRVLPHLFPTSNRDSFEAVLRHAIGVDKPPSDQAQNARTTDLGTTRFFAEGNFFRGSQRRVLVVFTDAETKRYDVDRLTDAFSTSGIRTILVRFWAEGERIYSPDGVEETYVSDASSAEAAERYAQAVKGETFDEREIPAVTQAVRAKLGAGTSITRVKTVEIEPLGPFVLFAALLPLSYLLVRRNLG